MPILGVTGKFKHQSKLINFNIKHLIDKIGDKEFHAMKSCNNSRTYIKYIGNESKQKKFIITKKSTSFTKHKEERGIKTALHEPIEGYGYSSKKIERDKTRNVKTPLD